MFEKNNVVFHTSAGICQIDDIRNENFTGDERLYYVMHPVNHNGRSVIYVPVDAKKSPIRSVLSEKEINQVIIDSKNEDIEWIDNNNLRKASFNEILHSDNISRIIAMISILHRRKEKIMTNGKKKIGRACLCGIRGLFGSRMFIHGGSPGKTQQRAVYHDP